MQACCPQYCMWSRCSYWPTMWRLPGATMLINRATWQRALQWNKFHYTFPSLDSVRLGLKVSLTTRSLTIPFLSESRQKRLQLINDLFESGLSTRTIADLFNALSIPAPNGGSYSPSLVWVTIDKWRKRQHRTIDEYTYFSVPMFYQLTQEGDFT